RRLERRLDRWRDIGPVALVLFEVELRDRPLLRLPAPVEGGAVVLRAEERVHLCLDILHGHVDELVERGLLDPSDGLESGSVGHAAMLCVQILRDRRLRLGVSRGTAAPLTRAGAPRTSRAASRCPRAPGSPSPARPP